MPCNDATRREFIKQLGKSLAVGALTTSGIGGWAVPAMAGGKEYLSEAPKYARTSYEIDAITFYSWVDTNIRKKYFRAGCMLNIAPERRNRFPTNSRVKPDTPIIDPGYHIIACETWTSLIKDNNSGINGAGGDMESTYYEKFIERNSNPNMKNFADSLFEFNRRWTLKKSSNLEQIERGFLSAIFGSLNLPLKNVEWYMSNETPQEQREQYISKILPKIEEMKKGVDIRFPPEGIRDPNHPFYKLILIREASANLIYHYANHTTITLNNEEKKKLGKKNI